MFITVKAIRKLNLGRSDKLEKSLKLAGVAHVIHTTQNLVFSRYWSFQVLFSVVSVARRCRRRFLKLSSEGIDSPPGPKGRGHCEEMAVSGVATVVDKVNFTIAVSS